MAPPMTRKQKKAKKAAHVVAAAVEPVQDPIVPVPVVVPDPAIVPPPAAGVVPPPAQDVVVQPDPQLLDQQKKARRKEQRLWRESTDRRMTQMTGQIENLLGFLQAGIDARAGGDGNTHLLPPPPVHGAEAAPPVGFHDNLAVSMPPGPPPPPCTRNCHMAAFPHPVGACDRHLDVPLACPPVQAATSNPPVHRPAYAPVEWRPVPHPPMSVNDPSGAEEVTRRLAQLVAAATTTGKNDDPHFPHAYIRRGPRRERATLGELTFPEYMYGLLKLHDAPVTPVPDRAHLRLHMAAIAADASRYQWDGLREWSEAVIAEITFGDWVWSDAWKIEMKRVELATRVLIDVSTPLQNAAQPGNKREAPAVVDLSPQLLAARPAPPCAQFNAGVCKQKGDHVDGGFRRLHICSLCLSQQCRARSHPECRCYLKDAAAKKKDPKNDNGQGKQ